MFGLRVRGQCTRTTGRKGGAVGVKKVARPMPGGPPGAPPQASGAASPAAPASTPNTKEGLSKESERK
jgi:small subunit ribosomal protein S13